MRKQSILLFLCMGISAQINAEKLIFSKNNEEIDITGDVIIDNTDGNITVTTSGDDTYLIVNEDRPVILGFYPDSYEAEIGTGNGVGVTWVVANADSCTANTVGQNSSDWTGSKSADDGKNPQAPESVTFTSLPSTLELECSNAFNSVTEDFTVTVKDQVVSNPTINFFRVNGSSSPNANLTGNGATATISWSTTDVNNCNASSSTNLTGWNSSTNIGTTGITAALPISESTVVTLTCDSLPPLNININFTPEGNPECNSVTLPPLLTSEPAKITYTELNQGNPFGTSNDTNARFDFSVNRYLQISGFSTDKTDFYRIIQHATAPAGSNTSWVQSISISECPGDFTASATCVFLASPGGQTQNRITTNQNETNPNICKIQPNTTYYMNVIHDQFPFDATPGRCANQAQQTCALFFTETLDQED